MVAGPGWRLRTCSDGRYTCTCTCSQEVRVLTAVTATPCAHCLPPCRSRPGRDSHYRGDEALGGEGACQLSHTVSKWPNQSAGATRRTSCLACLSDGCPPYQDLLALTPGKVEGRETLQGPQAPDVADPIKLASSNLLNSTFIHLLSIYLTPGTDYCSKCWGCSCDQK